MKFLKETFITIVCVLALIYVLFSFGNGTFNFQFWPEKGREIFAAFGALASIFIFAIQALRYW